MFLCIPCYPLSHGREFSVLITVRPLLTRSSISSLLLPCLLKITPKYLLFSTPLIPVSYTHLDVYERQVQYCFSNSFHRQFHHTMLPKIALYRLFFSQVISYKHIFPSVKQTTNFNFPQKDISVPLAILSCFLTNSKLTHLYNTIGSALAL